MNQKNDVSLFLPNLLNLWNTHDWKDKLKESQKGNKEHNKADAIQL
jgi:hypothetical protein